MGAAGDDATRTVVQAVNYVGGEPSAQAVREALGSFVPTVQAALETLSQLIADNRSVRTELVGELQTGEELLAHIKGEPAEEDPRAWSSGVRRMVGYTPGKASMAVSQRSIAGWLSQEHARLAARAERARSRSSLFAEQSKALAAVCESTGKASQDAERNRRSASDRVRILATHLARTADRSSPGDAARHAAEAELGRHALAWALFSVAEPARTASLGAIRELVSAVDDISARTETYRSSADSLLEEARHLVLGVDPSAEEGVRGPAVAAALAALTEAAERAAQYVGDIQISARQGVERWNKWQGEHEAWLAEQWHTHVEPFDADESAAIRSVVEKLGGE